MRGPAAFLLFAALAAPAVGDTVYLVNGNRFEDVVAETAAGAVRIRMPNGEIVLPERTVARVERSRSAWQVFDERERDLRAAEAPAREWLELARWADRAEYSEGLRRAVLRAAELDFRLEGLAPLMARIGYRLEPEAGEWLAEEVFMRRRGYRLWGDQWLAADEYAARLRLHEDAAARRREEAREELIARAIEALVAAELSRAAAPAPAPPAVETRAPAVAVYSGGYVPFLGPTAPVPAATGPGQVTYEDLASRQPGSLFPIRPRRHLTSSE